MKKTLIAAAVMATSGIAFAASNVTLYGTIDAGAVVQKVKDKTATVKMRSGFDSGSRWGIKGIEDLGNGCAVGFQLEQGFEIDNGADTASNSKGESFGREARLYVKGNFGEVGFGRFGTLASGAGSYSILQGWVFGTSYFDQGSWTAGFAKANGRVDNAIAYVSPEFAGFTLHAMYSNGTSNTLGEEGDANKWSKNNHYYGLGVKYAGGPANASLIFEAADNKSNFDVTSPVTTADDALGLANAFGNKLGLGKTYFKAASGTTEANFDDEFEGRFKAKTAYGITAGGSYDFGVIQLMGIYQYAWQSDFYKQHAFGIGAKAPVAGGTFGFGTRMLLGKLEGTAKDILVDTESGQSDKYRVWNIGANYKYPLSKRTSLWTFAGYSKGSKFYKDVDVGAMNAWSAGFGMIHTF